MTNWLLVPIGVVTVTCTVPVPSGVVAVICVSEMTVNEGACVAPKRTAVAPVKPVPVTTTVVPPAVEPEVGETEMTAGVAAARGCVAEAVGVCAELFTAVILREREPPPAAEEMRRPEAREGSEVGPGRGRTHPVRA